MNPHDQLAAYRQAMGSEAVLRQFAADNRGERGVCKDCGAGLGAAHKKDCEFDQQRRLSARMP